MVLDSANMAQTPARARTARVLAATIASILSIRTVMGNFLVPDHRFSGITSGNPGNLKFGHVIRAIIKLFCPIKFNYLLSKCSDTANF